ncbi:MAG: hypothetical protein ACI3XX_04935 [Eubacteriales bacterium]
MIDAGTLQTITTVIYIAFAVVAVLGVLRGLMKGFYKSIVDVIFVVIEVALSFLIARLISSTFTNVDKFNSLLESVKGFASKSEAIVGYIEKIQEYSYQLAEADGVVNLAMALPVVIICPLIFGFIYTVVGLILKIPKFIIERLLFGSNGGEEYKGGNRVCGAVVGGVRNVLVFAILLVPLVGFINIPGMIVDAASEAKPTEDGKTASYTEYIKTADEEYITPVKNNIILKGIYNCGGKWMFNSLSSVKVDGIKVSLSNDLCTIARVESYASYFYGVPVEEYGKEQTDNIEKIKDTINDSAVIPTLISGTLSYVSQTWLEGGNVFGYEKLDVGEYYQPTFDELLAIFAELDTESSKEDIETIATVAEIAIDSGLLRECMTEGGDVISVVSSEKFMTDLVLELYDNVRMRTFLEMGTNSFTNYIYKLYDNVNGTNTPWCEQVDLDAVSREEMMLEAIRLANIISSVTTFAKSVYVSDSGEIDFAYTFINSDVGALGRALDLMKDSVIFGNSYKFVVEAVLRSESCAQLGIINEDFIQLVIKNDTNLENLLVTRQNMAKITTSVKSGDDISGAIEAVLKNLSADDAEVLKRTVTPEALQIFGMSEKKADIMSKTLNSVMDGITSTGEISDEDIEKEVQAVDKIVNVAQAAASSSTSNVFSATEGEESKTGMTADELVSSIMDSEIITTAVQSAAKDEEGNKVEDPYGISSALGEEDKQAASDAIKNYYTENKTEENDEEMKDTLSSIAAILGVDTSGLF